MTSLSIKKLAIRGAIWTIAGFGTSQVLRFCSNLILTRLLVPEFFGLMAIVNTLRMGIELFSDLGISQSIVNNKRGDEAIFLNTAWTLQVLRGLILWLFCLLMTFPVARFYNDDRLLWLIPIVGLTSIFDGLASTSINTLHRRMALGKYTIFTVLVQTSSLIALVLLCWYSRTIWSLGIGVALTGLIRMVGTYCLIPGYVNRFAWEKESIKEILSFGRWMFAASAFMFVAEQSDRLILGKLLSFEVLGVYTVAYTLANVPREIIKQLSNRVIFPAIAKQIDLPRASLREKIIRQRRLILIGFAIFLAVLVSTGDLIIGKLYDNRYTEATWMMPILSAGIWFSLLFYTISPALLAIGKPLYSAQGNLAGFITIALGLPIAFYNFGTVGAIIAISLSDFPLYIVNLYGLRREKLFCFAQDVQSTALFIGLLIGLLTLRHSLGFGLPIQAILNGK
jgi:O-antigen/teichoic acid export membrane protein